MRLMQKKLSGRNYLLGIGINFIPNNAKKRESNFSTLFLCLKM